MQIIDINFKSSKRSYDKIDVINATKQGNELTLNTIPKAHLTMFHVGSSKVLC